MVRHEECQEFDQPNMTDDDGTPLYTRQWCSCGCHDYVTEEDLAQTTASLLEMLK